jgi:hypothetical protein
MVRLEPPSLAIVVVLAFLAGVVAIAEDWPLWTLYLSGTATIGTAVVGYARWDERHRP